LKIIFKGGEFEITVTIIGHVGGYSVLGRNVISLSVINWKGSFMPKRLRISKHGKTRLKERSGISGNRSNKMAQRALLHGISAEDTLDELRQWVFDRNLSDHGSLYIYAGMAYIFRHNTLTTAIKVPEDLNGNIKAYVEEEAWKKYEKYRELLHRHKVLDYENMNVKRFPYIYRHTIKALVNRFFRENDIPFIAVNVTHNYERNFTVRFISDNPNEDKKYFRMIREWGEREQENEIHIKTQLESKWKLRVDT
jgi:hypothetical protein